MSARAGLDWLGSQQSAKDMLCGSNPGITNTMRSVANGSKKDSGIQDRVLSPNPTRRLLTSLGESLVSVLPHHLDSYRARPASSTLASQVCAKCAPVSVRHYTVSALRHPKSKQVFAPNLAKPTLKKQKFKKNNDHTGISMRPHAFGEGIGEGGFDETGDRQKLSSPVIIIST